MFLYFLELVKIHNKACKDFHDGVPAQLLTLTLWSPRQALCS